MNNMKKTALFVLVAVALLSAAYHLRSRYCVDVRVSPFPGGRNFAFTVTDDPDDTRTAKVLPVYRFLHELGFKTTMACWVFKPGDVSGLPDPEEQQKSDTLLDKEYLEFIRDYKRKGYEIGIHTVTSGHDKREVTAHGYEVFKELFGEYPKINIMHSQNKENIYWGKNTFKNPLMKMLVGMYTDIPFSGEEKSSPYFWGDICKDKSKYIRLWGTSGINTLAFNPSMPYHDEDKPFVNYYYSFSDGYNFKYFTKLLTEKNIKKLVKERGACIVYTHFAAGFCRKMPDGSYVLKDEAKNALLNVAKEKEGWFVPVSELLDRLLLMKKLALARKGEFVEVVNNNTCDVNDVTIMVKPGEEYFDASGTLHTANDDGEIALGDFKTGETKTIKLKGCFAVRNTRIEPGFLEKNNLVIERLRIMLFSHRG